MTEGTTPSSMEIRAARPDDFSACVALYRDLTGDIPVADQIQFENVLAQSGTTIFVADLGGELASMATLHLMENMTYGGRPYAFVENVVTRKSHRGRGLSRAVMSHIEEIIWAAGGYKIMLLTGRDYGARGFYEALGYDGDEKVAMVKRVTPPRHPS